MIAQNWENVRGEVVQPAPGLAKNHETALKKFLSVSELAIKRAMATTYVLGSFRLDAETDALFRDGESVSLDHRAVALLRKIAPFRQRYARPRETAARCRAAFHRGCRL
jgi:hypothetical protein